MMRYIVYNGYDNVLGVFYTEAAAKRFAREKLKEYKTNGESLDLGCSPFCVYRSEIVETFV